MMSVTCRSLDNAYKFCDNLFIKKGESLISDVYPPDSPNLSWMQRGPNKRHTGVACRLPDCVKVIPRSRTGRRKWFCDDHGHAEEFARRRESLDKAIAALEQALRGAKRNEQGECTARQHRDADRDLTYLRKVRIAYQSPDDLPR